jgi:hypothetical protein
MASRWQITAMTVVLTQKIFMTAIKQAIFLEDRKTLY